MEPTTRRPASPGLSSRRSFLFGAVGVAGALVLGACSAGAGTASEETSTSAGEGSGESRGWSFTDDRGVTHELDAPPERIVAQSVMAGGLWEYGMTAVGVFGPLRRPDGTPDPAVGLADPDDFTSLGEIDGQINLEQMAAVRPQIVVVPMWDDDVYWGIDDAQVPQVEQLAPLVAIRVGETPITDPLARLAALAESILGSDEAIREPKDAFDAASGDLSAAIDDNPGLQVVAASGTPAEMYIAWPPGFPELRYYQDLGMELVVPEEHPTQDGYWETLSWEESDKYPVDLVLADARGGSVDDILDQLPATARALPAIAAGQITEWPTVQAYGYGNVARNLEALTDAVASADPGIA